MGNILRRGRDLLPRLHIPEARWADVGRAMGAAGGIKRELVRTLQTTDRREAEQRRDTAISAMRADVKRRCAGQDQPLTDWTADWTGRAVQRRREMEEGANVVLFHEQDPSGDPEDPASRSAWTAADMTRDDIVRDAEAVEVRQGPEAAQAFLAVALGDGLSVAEAARRWLEGEHGKVKEQTINGHRAALAKLGAYLAKHHGRPTLEAVALGDVTRRMVGEFLAERRGASAGATVMREFSAYSGLWRWAVRRGYAELNPWSDQAAGMKAKTACEAEKAPERGY